MDVLNLSKSYQEELFKKLKKVIFSKKSYSAPVKVKPLKKVVKAIKANNLTAEEAISAIYFLIKENDRFWFFKQFNFLKEDAVAKINNLYDKNSLTSDYKDDIANLSKLE